VIEVIEGWNEAAALIGWAQDSRIIPVIGSKAEPL